MRINEELQARWSMAYAKTLIIAQRLLSGLSVTIACYCVWIFDESANVDASLDCFVSLNQYLLLIVVVFISLSYAELFMRINEEFRARWSMAYAKTLIQTLCLLSGLCVTIVCYCVWIFDDKSAFYGCIFIMHKNNEERSDK